MVGVTTEELGGFLQNHVAINWKCCHLCTYPLHIWIMVDYTAVFVFCLLMFIDNGIASMMAELPEEGQKWGFLIWLLFSYCRLICIACMLVRMVLVDMIWLPDWAFEAAGQEMRGMGEDAASYLSGLYFTPTQREAVEALIQELPKLELKAVPTDCSECPICLDESHLGNEVRDLHCAHNFHVECIDRWLRLNVKCLQFGCLVFPNLDLSSLSNIHADSVPSPCFIVITSQYMRTQPLSQSYFLRLRGWLQPVSAENAGSPSVTDVSLDTAENGHVTITSREFTHVELVASAGHDLVP